MEINQSCASLFFHCFTWRNNSQPSRFIIFAQIFKAGITKHCPFHKIVNSFERGNLKLPDKDLFVFLRSDKNIKVKEK